MARMRRVSKLDECDIRELIFALIENEDGELDDFDSFYSWCESMAEVAFDRDMNGEPLPNGVGTIVKRTASTDTPHTPAPGEGE